MREYVILSIETHLFFTRIMKEHSLFLLASLPEKETDLKRRAECFRKGFEEGLKKTVRLADGMVGNAILDSGEIVTEFTQKAECQTSRLTGIPVDTEITEAEKCLQSGCPSGVSRETVYQVRMLNRKMLECLNGLIAYKEEILQKVLSCKLYTTNYPLLIEHILREARLYRQFIMQLERNGCIAMTDLRNTEAFWNQIMMEHAEFIRGLLDPTECELIQSANGFAMDYCELLEGIKEQDSRNCNACHAKSVQLTDAFQKFKHAGTEGITDCNIRSVILPLLADHVLREANHYLRILEQAQNGGNRCGMCK